MSGYGSQATALATTSTSASGGFKIAPGTYACPASGAPLYIVSSGGNPGNTTTTQNPTGVNSAAVLVSLIGTCGSVEENSFFNVDEASTIAAAYALNGFMNSADFGTSSNLGIADAIGVNLENSTGLTNAFATANILVNPTTGQTPGTSSNASVESSKLNMLANLLSSCVNTDPTSSTTCSTLFTDVTPAGATVASNTFEAAFYLASNPISTNSAGSHIATLYGLVTGTPPFQPTLSTVPADWTIAVNYQIPTLASAENLAVDASGNVWIDGDGDGSTISASIVELTPTGSLATTITSDGGSNAVNAPRQIAVDLLGNVWVTNSGANTLFEITGSTVAAVIPTGATPSAMAIDGSNNIWLSEINASSKVLTECPYDPVNLVFCTSLTVYSGIGTQTLGMAIDPTAGNVWITNLHSSTFGNLAQYQVSDGTQVATYYTSQTSNADLPIGIAFDASNNIWYSNEGATAAASFLGVTSNPPSASPIGIYTGGGLNGARFLSIDGAGNVWVANNALSTAGTYSISEFSNTGSALSPNTTGFAHGFASPIAVAVDGSGNVWVANNSTTSNFVSELIGAATPVVTPVSVATANGTVGSVPGNGGSGGSTGGGGNSPGGLLIPTTGAYFGAWANPPGSGSVATEIAALETQIGRQFAIHLHYFSWTDSFPNSEVTDDLTGGHNRVPLISMHCNMADVNVTAGNEDASIRAVADGLKSYGSPVMFRWMWEFNLISGHTSCLLDPNKTSDPVSVQATDFIAAWRHIWAVFQQEGATNVIFVWNPSGTDGIDPTPFYPGDRYVDWIGIDHYDKTANNPSFNAVWSGPYAINNVHNKPIIIAETGAYAATQGVYLQQAESLLKTQYPLVKAFCYFDAPGQSSPGYVLTGTGITSYINMANDSYFSLMP
ncbi:MAG: glycosyl hydrolase [Acidobacteriaceae bacterium]|nr:glycosyl hydrolase [Acidobacteriaceae bacterium]